MSQSHTTNTPSEGISVTTNDLTVDQIDGVRRRLRERQLSFDVGGAIPDAASLKTSGTLAVSRDLKKGEEIRVTVTDADGQVIAAGEGYITSVSFIDKRDKYGDIESTERAHKADIH